MKNLPPMTTMVMVMTLAALTACSPSSTTDEDEIEPTGDELVDPEIVRARQEVSPPKSVTTDACKNTFDFEKELVIRDLRVVEDAARTTGMGAWTFGHLVEELAGPRDPKTLAREWLATWEASPVIDGETVAGNAGKVDDLLLGPWQADGFALDKAPFRLSAITLRPDLATGPELRFVFSGVTPAPARAAMPFNVAFEYRVTKAFVRQWYDTLHPLAKGSAPYRDALATLTELGIHDAAGINGSSLRQLRTNEVAIDSPWDLREFHLTAATGGTLARARLAGQPRIELDGSDRLAGGVTAAMETYTAIVPSREFAWRVPGVSAQKRFDFAIGTCAGCHSKETNTEFVHIKPRELGKTADLSSFLQSRECAADDKPCQRLESADEFTDPMFTSHTYRTQDDRMTALNRVLAAAGDCQ